ncbi:hypothetical protein EN742_31200, partial [Mesorhizobium sp. M4A.F.Ca.ET.020.02.1.1]
MPNAGGTAPPLSCRTSPPQGGRSDVPCTFANRQRCRRAPAPKLPISPLEGEMPGRAEGGGLAPTLQESSSAGAAPHPPFGHLCNLSRADSAIAAGAVADERPEHLWALKPVGERGSSSAVPS